MATPTTWGYWSFIAMTGNTLIDALMWGTKWTSSSISYSFPAAASYWSTSTVSGYDAPGSSNEPWFGSMQGLFTQDQAAVRTALAAWANVANLSFTEVSDSAAVVGDLRFAYTSGDHCGNFDSQAWAYFPGNTVRGGDVWFNTQESSFTHPWEPGSYEYQTVLHEIGHTLGLKHPFDNSPLNSTALPVPSDTRSYTLMSYRAGEGLDGSSFSYEPTTPMVLDIMAVQAIYGTNTTYNAGNTTYSFGSGLYHETIWDAGGSDAIVDLSSLGCTIDLNEGAGSQVGASVFVENSAGTRLSEACNLWIAFGTTIENATGGGGDDLLIGNGIGNVLTGGGGADTFRGGAGADTIDGGAGNDTAVYGDSKGNYIVSFDAVTSTFTVLSIWEGTDSVKNVETFEFGGVAFSAASFMDLAAPTVALFNPVDEASGVAIGSNVVVTFNEAIQRGNGSIVLKTAAGAIVASYEAATSSNLTVSGAQLTINPSADLAYSTGYKIELAAGSVRDLSGNSYAGSTAYNFTTAAQPLGQQVNGSGGADSLTGGPGNDTVNGGGGIDCFAFSGNRSQYSLTKTAGGYQVQDTAGRDGTDSLAGVETLLFADCTVDLTMGQKAVAIAAVDLKTLQELYVGFFNRIPEAAGLAYWISQIQSGASLKAVADRFYDAGVEFGVYAGSMTEAQFITAIYANVLGRTGAAAPNGQETGYWQGWLHTGSHSKGGMVLQMLSDSHGKFTGDPAVGWVVDLLDNKAKVASYFAIDLGMTYHDRQMNIAKGTEFAAAISPHDITAAIELVGIPG